MPFAFVIIGLVLLVSGVRNTQGELFDLVKGDFTGEHNFIFWTISILIIGAVGYIPRLKPVSNSFLVLVIVVLFLSNKGFFANFNQQIGATETSGSKDTSVGSLPKAGIF